jgi:hypothetical protein
MTEIPAIVIVTLMSSDGGADMLSHFDGILAAAADRGHPTQLAMVKTSCAPESNS